MLHRVVEQRSEKPEQRELEVTPDWLENKILEYQKRGYSFVSIDHLPRKGRWVCITLDDGYQDNYQEAYPLFKRLNVPFVIFVTSGFVDNKKNMWWYPGQRLGMTMDALKELCHEPLCTIGAHTVSHTKLDTLSYSEQYNEIAQSKIDLEHYLGKEVHHFSFPHGTYNVDTLDICKKLGFQTVLQSWGGFVRYGENPCPLPRINQTEPE